MIMSVFEELLELLEVRSADVVFGTAGVLVNMMNDIDRRQQFIQQQGLPRSTFSIPAAQLMSSYRDEVKKVCLAGC